MYGEESDEGVSMKNILLTTFTGAILLLNIKLEDEELRIDLFKKSDVEQIRPFFLHDTYYGPKPTPVCAVFLKNKQIILLNLREEELTNALNRQPK